MKARVEFHGKCRNYPLDKLHNSISPKRIAFTTPWARLTASSLSMALATILLVAPSLSLEITLISQEVLPEEIHCSTSRSRGVNLLVRAPMSEGRESACALVAANNAINSVAWFAS